MLRPCAPRWTPLDCRRHASLVPTPSQTRERLLHRLVLCTQSRWHACPATSQPPLIPSTKLSIRFPQAVLDDVDVRAAVGAIGIHGAIPTNPHDTDTCTSAVCMTQLPRFVSEDGSTYGDPAGALLRVMQCHQEHLGQPGHSFGLSQGSNFWNPFGSYYPALPFYGETRRWRVE